MAKCRSRRSRAARHLQSFMRRALCRAAAVRSIVSALASLGVVAGLFSTDYDGTIEVLMDLSSSAAAAAPAQALAGPDPKAPKLLLTALLISRFPEEVLGHDVGTPAGIAVRLLGERVGVATTAVLADPLDGSTHRLGVSFRAFIAEFQQWKDGDKHAMLEDLKVSRCARRWNSQRCLTPFRFARRSPAVRRGSATCCRTRR